MPDPEAIEGSDLLAYVIDTHPMNGEMLLRLVDPSDVAFLPPVGEMTMVATPKVKTRNIIVPSHSNS